MCRNDEHLPWGWTNKNVTWVLHPDLSPGPWGLDPGDGEVPLEGEGVWSPEHRPYPAWTPLIATGGGTKLLELGVAVPTGRNCDWHQRSPVISLCFRSLVLQDAPETF